MMVYPKSLTSLIGPYIYFFHLQVPDKTQRLEELAIKQSRQLIPMTPSTPKPLVSALVVFN